MLPIIRRLLLPIATQGLLLRLLHRLPLLFHIHRVRSFVVVRTKIVRVLLVDGVDQAGPATLGSSMFAITVLLRLP